jgi:hypothetical protein
VIRRAVWLAAGAAGGIYGYRRLGRLARSLGLTRLAAAGGFWRDVRDGMDEYLDQHSPPGNTLLARGNGRAHSPGSDNPKDGR